ncbi:Transcriptional regulatory protein, partial [Dispira parvispora]
MDHTTEETIPEPTGSTQPPTKRAKTVKTKGKASPPAAEAVTDTDGKRPITRPRRASSAAKGTNVTTSPTLEPRGRRKTTRTKRGQPRTTSPPPPSVNEETDTTTETPSQSNMRTTETPDQAITRRVTSSDADPTSVKTLDQTLDTPDPLADDDDLSLADTLSDVPSGTPSPIHSSDEEGAISTPTPLNLIKENVEKSPLPSQISTKDSEHVKITAPGVTPQAPPLSAEPSKTTEGETKEEPRDQEQSAHKSESDPNSLTTKGNAAVQPHGDNLVPQATTNRSQSLETADAQPTQRRSGRRRRRASESALSASSLLSDHDRKSPENLADDESESKPNPIENKGTTAAVPPTTSSQTGSPERSAAPETAELRHSADEQVIAMAVDSKPSHESSAKLEGGTAMTTPDKKEPTPMDTGDTLADATSETDTKDKVRKEALTTLGHIEEKFAKLREKLYMDKLHNLEEELRLVETNEHPDLVDRLSKLEARRTRCTQEARNWYDARSKFILAMHEASLYSIQCTLDEGKRLLRKGMLARCEQEQIQTKDMKRYVDRRIFEKYIPQPSARGVQLSYTYLKSQFPSDLATDIVMSLMPREIDDDFREIKDQLEAPSRLAPPTVTLPDAPLGSPRAPMSTPSYPPSYPASDRYYAQPEGTIHDIAPAAASYTNDPYYSSYGYP